MSVQKERGFLHEHGAPLLSMLLVVMVPLALLGIAFVRNIGASAPKSSVHASVATATHPPPSTPTADLRDRPDLQTGIVFKRHNSNTGYGPDDPVWQSGLPELKSSTGAQWIEMVVEIYQDAPGSSSVYTGQGTPTPENLRAGIIQAHQLGLHVFLAPLVSPLSGSLWSGNITFADAAHTQAWFDSYWTTLKPFFQVAQEKKVEQLAIGLELSELEQAPDAYWIQLIDRVRNVYSGTLTYDMNWTSLYNAYRPWMLNSALSYIGVQEYESLTNGPYALTEAQIAAIWRQHLLPAMDAFSKASDKKLIITEIGYHNTNDALYYPANWSTSAPPNPALQAAAYQAAIEAVFGDPHVEGIYLFAWDEGIFSPGPQAVSITHSLYLSPKA